MQDNVREYWMVEWRPLGSAARPRLRFCETEEEARELAGRLADGGNAATPWCLGKAKLKGK